MTRPFYTKTSFEDGQHYQRVKMYKMYSIVIAFTRTHCTVDYGYYNTSLSTMFKEYGKVQHWERINIKKYSNNKVLLNCLDDDLFMSVWSSIL